MIQETYCILHVFGLAKSVKLHHMSYFHYMGYC